MVAVTVLPRTAPRARAFVRVAGPDAADLLQRLVSNDVVALAPGTSCDALLLTAKGRVIAPLRILRRDDDDYLLLTEPELGERVERELVRLRFAARCEIAREEHALHLVLGRSEGGIPTRDYGVPAVEILDGDELPGAERVADEELERLRILAGTPRFGREVDDRVLPAEAGLVETHVSLSKGCFPGQEPVARLHYRGKVNRRLRVLELEGAELPGYDAEIRLGDKVVGRITSAARDEEAVVALGYVRVEVPEDAALVVDGRPARLH